MRCETCLRRQQMGLRKEQNKAGAGPQRLSSVRCSAARLWCARPTAHCPLPSVRCGRAHLAATACG